MKAVTELEVLSKCKNNGQVIILLIYGGFLDLLGRRPANLSICRSAHFRVQTKLGHSQRLKITGEPTLLSIIINNNRVHLTTTTIITTPCQII